MDYLKPLIKNTYYRFLREHPFFYIGKFILLFKNKNYLLNEYGPKKLKSNDKSFLGECIRRVFNFYYYNKMNDEERNEYNLKHIWGSENGDQWHKMSFERSKNSGFKDIEDRKSLIDCLNSIVDEQNKFDCIEIGVGNGLFLEYLSKNTNFISYTGLDISSSIIDFSKKRYKENKKLNFFNKDPYTYIENLNVTQNIVIISCATLQCFMENDLVRLFKVCKKFNKIYFAIFEPINIDLSKVFKSEPRKNVAFSHNYPYLFKNNGYEEEYFKLNSINPNIPNYKMITLITHMKAKHLH